MNFKNHFEDLVSHYKEILDIYRNHGYNTYLVGGAVRDSLLGLPVADVDLTTDATPEETEALFEVVSDYGRNFGTLLIRSGEIITEVTSFRTERDYKDFRRPEYVSFGKDLKTDLSRRDFTVNALAVDQDGKLYDFFGGIKDLEDKLIRTVGDPEKRFHEDSLRMWRAVRFCSQKGFSLEEKTFKAILKNPSIKGISPERIQDELKKILISQNVSRGTILLLRTGLLENFLEEFGVASSFDLLLYERQAVVLDKLPNELPLRLLILKNTLSLKRFETLLSDLRFKKKIIKKALLYAEIIEEDLKPERLKRQLAVKLPREDLLKFISIYSELKGLSEEETVGLMRSAKKILENHEPLYRSELAVTGRDLQELGYQNRQISEKLSELYDFILENPDKNQRKILLKEASNG